MSRASPRMAATSGTAAHGAAAGQHRALWHRHSGRRVTRVPRAERGAGPGASGRRGAEAAAALPQALPLPPGTWYF